MTSALDRTNGRFLLGEPFVHQTWAVELDDSERPIVLPESFPTAAGAVTCPAIHGATNWWSSSSRRMRPTNLVGTP